MKLMRKGLLAATFIAVIAAGSWTLNAAEKGEQAAAEASAKVADVVVAELEPLPALETCLDAGLDDGKTAVMKGKPGGACCDPSLQPGFCGNPFCFEGATCCSDGVWRCNQGNGKPVCSSGKVCASGPDPCGEPCGGKGDSCTVGDDCCSGTCGKNGRCR